MYTFHNLPYITSALDSLYPSGMDGWHLSVLPFLLLTLGRGLRVHHQDAAGQRTQTWGTGVSTQVAGCACCWHTWKSFSSHTGKYLLVFGYFCFSPWCNFPLLSAHICKTHWRSLGLFSCSLLVCTMDGICSCCLLLCWLCWQRSGRGSDTSMGVNIAGLCGISAISSFKI